MPNASLQYEPIPLTRLPAWFRQEIPDMAKIRWMQNLLKEAHLNTVCESARCPNIGQCWGKGVATFMILGDVCTRACRFCAVAAGRPQQIDTEEPQHVAAAVKALNLKYVVITSVARDDLADQGAGHFAQTIVHIRRITPETKIEILIPDFSARIESLKTVIQASPHVISHNIETVERLSLAVRPQADYQRSLQVLRMLKQMGGRIFVKSSFMVGLGETLKEVIELMKDLRTVGCDILTIGQYLAPTRLKRHVRVKRFVAPQEFERYRHLGKEFGFRHVMSGPLVRSSYIAEEGYRECVGSL